jgi:hypothetical protein
MTENGTYPLPQRGLPHRDNCEGCGQVVCSWPQPVRRIRVAGTWRR